MQNSDLEAKNTVETSSNEKFVGKNAELVRTNKHKLYNQLNKII